MFQITKKQKSSNVPSSTGKNTPTLTEPYHHKLTRRELPLLTTPPPRLIRSRSQAEHISPVSLLHTKNQRLAGRSKSTSRSTTIKGEYGNMTSPIYSSYNYSLLTTRKKSSDQESNCSSDGGVRAGPCRGGCHRKHSLGLTKAKPATGSSPSAWALSPGRSTLMSPNLPERPRESSRESGKAKSGGVGGVMKYFRQKKVCPLQKESFHRFRVLYNRLLQWRFANARAEASMVARKIAAEDRIFHVWLRIINVRSSILEKRIEVEKYKNDIKLLRIVQPQVKLLREWESIESRNCEAVSRTARKLSALSLRLPLVDNAEGDVESTREAMSMAMGVMESTEVTVKMLFSQVEKVLFLVTELASAIEHQNESLEEMEHLMTFVVKLLELEKGARVQLIQVLGQLEGLLLEEHVVENSRTLCT